MWFLALVVVAISLPLTYRLDYDFGWHLALGRQVHENSELVRTLVGYNYFSEYHLIDHQWLSHLVGYPLYQWFGYPIFVFGAFLVLLLTVWILWSGLRRSGYGFYPSVLSISLFLFSATVIYGVRLQILVLLGMALLRYLGVSSLSFGKRLLAYGLVFLIGNNLHGGFLMLAAIPFFMEGERSLHEGGFVAWRRFGLIMVVILFALCANPYGFDFWRLTWDYLADPYYKAHIAEWLPVYSSGYLAVKTGISLAIVILLLSVRSGLRKMPISEVILLGLFGYLGVAHVRFFPLFILIAIPGMAAGLTRMTAGLSGTRSYLRLVAVGILALFLLYALVIVDYGKLRWPSQPELTPGYPTAAMAVMSGYPECTNGLFNEYVWGGYIMGFYPDTKVFVDGRGPQLKLDTGKTLLETYADIHSESDTSKAEDELDKYGMRCVLLAKSEKDGLGKALEGSNLWTKEFEDDIGVVFVRKP